MKGIIPGIMLTLLLIGMLPAAVRIKYVKGTWTGGTIYIKTDGNIVPSSAPIKRDGQIYRLTQDVKSDGDGLVVEMDRVLVDGGEHKIVGSRSSEIGDSKGVFLVGSYISIKNLEITGFHVGVFSNSGKCNNITENRIVNNTWGVGLWPSSNCTISGNQIYENAHHGIELLESAKFNTISDNNITKNGQIGIRIEGNSNDNRIYGNNITDNACAGMDIYYSSNNKIHHNNFAHNPSQAEAAPNGYTNYWDDGYPSGGNCWSDYAGADFFAGPCQNETGSDGIGDTPYVISEGNVDRYPIMPSASTHILPKVVTLPAYSRVSVLWNYLVGIVIEPVRNVWSFRITIQFNNAVASALEVTDRGFLNQPCATVSIIDNSRGIVNFESSEIEPAEPKTTGMLPSGLCRILFNASNPGTNYINLEATFYDKNRNLIPTTVQNATVSQEIPSEYILAPSFSDYSPSGMPDFDQTQQGWIGYCAPTSTANALWYVDSRCEALWNYLSGPPPLKNDICPIVTSYNSSFWDDHDARNVPFLVEELAFLMDTNGLRTGMSHIGCADFEAGLAQYLQIHGVNPVGDADGNGVVDEKDMTIVQEALGSTPNSPDWDLSADLNQDNCIDNLDLQAVEAHMGEHGMVSIAPIYPRSFEEVAELFRKGDAVVLFLDLFLDQEYFGGHAVTLAGICSDTHEVVVHDPHADAYEINRTMGAAAPLHFHPSGEPGATLHNDPYYVSNDAYVVENDSSGCFFSGYAISYIDDYTGQIVTVPPAKCRISGYKINYIPSEEHDVALLRVQPSRNIIANTSVTHINVTIANQGRNAEKCRLRVQANTTTIAVFDDLTLESQAIKIVTLTCDIGSLSYGKYTLNACVTPVKDETDTYDNQLTNLDITVSIPGDINADGKVNIMDLTIAAIAYQTYPRHAKWNSNADINEDRIINIIDLTMIALEYGKTV
jgi:parallel beta-helix repeat protein